MINNDVAELLRGPVTRTREILDEVKRIRTKPFLTEDDYRRLAELKVEMLELSPPGRFSWLNTKPCIDIWAELIRLSEGA
ncbi:MAG: hypothetical protein HPY65_17980 [Syntrophaceae bacterium]|nr:hypothetical protein [Syntrophaceae bacterium]